jgi:hypothetical protein
MEKRNYVKPILNSEAFVPQVYCANCGDEEIIGYKGGCDTTGYVFWDKNNDGEYQEETDEYASANYAGEDVCSFTITYRPTKNAFCFPSREWVSTGRFSGYYKGVGEGVYGARIAADGDTHFVANIENITEIKNHS